MSIHETYRIAHTARCKLQIAADRPDRNLRFILGHAFTLDNLRLQIAQIEQAIDSDSESDEDEPDIPSAPSPGVVSFPKSTNRPVTSSQRRRSPPPHRPAGLSDSDSSQEEDDEYEDDAAEDLRLERFGSAAGLPPRMIDDEGSDEEDELTSLVDQLSGDLANVKIVEHVAAAKQFNPKVSAALGAFGDADIFERLDRKSVV